MTTITPSAVAQFAIRAGFTGHDLITAVAVSFAEDNDHDLNARYNPAETGEDSRGLWQINIGGDLWADRRQLAHNHGVTLTSPDQLYAGLLNAQMAYWIYSRAGRKFGDWSTFLHGTYLRYWSGALAAVAALAAGTHTINLSRYLLRREPLQHGADVAAWQHVAGANPDGFYGPLTASATARWQRAHKDRQGRPLAADGIVGPLTAGAAGWFWQGPAVK